MKRPASPTAHGEGPAEADKRARSSLAWLGKALGHVKAACSSSGDAYHAAKQLVAEQAVGTAVLSACVLDAQLGCVLIQGAFTATNDNAAAFPHLTRPTPELPIAAQLCVDAASGEVLDAATSCCPGGFQCVLGSFCPYAAALLLQAAKERRLPTEGRVAARQPPLVRFGLARRLL
jgi:hypothetical protein